jgi:hypothetical protein
MDWLYAVIAGGLISTCKSGWLCRIAWTSSWAERWSLEGNLRAKFLRDALMAIVDFIDLLAV